MLHDQRKCTKWMLLQTEVVQAGQPDKQGTGSWTEMGTEHGNGNICAKLAWAEMTQLSCSQGQLGTYGSLTLFTSRTKINEKSVQQSIAIIKYLLV